MLFNCLLILSICRILLLTRGRFLMRKFLLCLPITPLMVSFQRSLEILVFQLFLAPLRIIMLELLYVIWVQELVLCHYLFKRGSLEKLTPSDISLQMADKSSAIPVGI